MSDFSTPYSPDCIDDLLGDPPSSVAQSSKAPTGFQDFSLQGCGLYNYNDEDARFDTQYGFVQPREQLPPRSYDQFQELSLPLRVIKNLVSELNITSRDRILDIGSGTGRLAVMLHTMTGATVRGVEIEDSYVSYASARADSYSAVSFEVGDGSQATLHNENIICLINPFRGALMENFLERVRAHYLEGENKDATSPVRIISQGICSFHLRDKPWLKQVGGGDGILSVGVFELQSSTRT